VHLHWSSRKAETVVVVEYCVRKLYSLRCPHFVFRDSAKACWCRRWDCRRLCFLMFPAANLCSVVRENCCLLLLSAG
jgi:hypothetical protein